MNKLPFSQRVGQALAALLGWEVLVEKTPPAKCVVIGAHHTSSFDFFLTLLFILASGVRLRWIAKDTAFRWPFGGLMRSLGGIPVSRRSRNNFVQQMADALAGSTSLRLAISPEGTRGATNHWKTGFYYIALGARVPIVLAYADYRTKQVGLGPTLEPTGDIQADLKTIQSFYAGVTARYPHKVGQIQLLVRDEAAHQEPDRRGPMPALGPGLVAEDQPQLP